MKSQETYVKLEFVSKENPEERIFIGAVKSIHKDTAESYMHLVSSNGLLETSTVSYDDMISLYEFELSIPYTSDVEFCPNLDNVKSWIDELKKYDDNCYISTYESDIEISVNKVAKVGSYEFFKRKANSPRHYLNTENEIKKELEIMNAARNAEEDLINKIQQMAEENPNRLKEIINNLKVD